MKKMSMTISGLLKEATDMIGDTSKAISRRTIHYYIYCDEKLLPRPEGEGRKARYNEKHLLYLLKIMALRSEGLSLEEIKKKLKEDLGKLKTDEEIRSCLDEIKAKAKTSEVKVQGDIEGLQTFLVEKVRNRIPKVKQHDIDAYPSLAAENTSTEMFSFADLSRGKPQSVRKEPTKCHHSGQEIDNELVPGGIQWVKFTLTDGLEVQVREDVLKKDRHRVLSWLASYSTKK